LAYFRSLSFPSRCVSCFLFYEGRKTPQPHSLFPGFFLVVVDLLLKLSVPSTPPGDRLSLPFLLFICMGEVSELEDPSGLVRSRLWFLSPESFQPNRSVLYSGFFRGNIFSSLELTSVVFVVAPSPSSYSPGIAVPQSVPLFLFFVESPNPFFWRSNAASVPSISFFTL